MRKTAKERKRIKESKQMKQPSTNMFINNDNEAVSFVKIIFVLVALILVFTVITDYIINKENKESKTVNIQYSDIIVGNILNRSESSYYVLVKNKNDENLATYNSYINQYKAKEEHLSFYTVDLEEGFNSPFKAESSNLYVTNISEIRFSNTSLLKIEDGKITYATDNSEEITNKLKELSA